MKHTGENVVRIEAEALRALADRIAGPMAADFQRAVDLMFCCAGRVVVTGMGKSGLIARKIAATLSSTGTPALYLHPVEAMHGDLGMIVRGDVVLALSASGETEEILALLATIKRLQVPLISMTGDEICGGQIPTLRKRAGWGSLDIRYRAKSRRVKSRAADRSVRATKSAPRLLRLRDVALDCSIAQEACSLGLGAYRFDYDDAGARRCAGSDFERAARVQGRRLCQPASGRKAGKETGARRIVDAFRRCSALCRAVDQNAGRDL